MNATLPSPSLRALVAGAVDYAGLFPPASLAMPEAVARYASHLRSADAWMLGRFVVPASRLSELAAEAETHRGANDAPWRVSALAGDDLAADAARIRAFNAEQGGRLMVDAVEVKTGDEARVALASRELGAGLTVYCEAPWEPDPRPVLEAVARHGLRAKVRTGGVTAEAFPDAARLARFVARCAALGLPFKATAGLHHPLRGEHRLTYEPGAPTATMFGFVNLFAAAALARAGAPQGELEALLEERRADALAFDADGLRWRRHALSLEELRAARDGFVVAFGSCSFQEPVDELRGLGLA